MPDKVALTIQVTEEERTRIETLAQESGYASVSDYLLALIEALTEPEPTKEELLEEFRQGWRAAMNDETIPAADLWDALHRDD